MRESTVLQRVMKLVFLASFILAIGSTGQAQLQFVIGQNSGSSTTYAYPTPFGNYYYGAHHQFVYRASELTAAGMPPGLITSLAFNVTNVNGAVAHQGFTIGIKNSTVSDLTAWETGFSTIYGPVAYQPVLGWNSFAFASNFIWDGTSNIIVDVCFNNTSYVANALTQWTTGLSGTPTRYLNQDASGVCANTTGYASTTRTDIRFTVSSLTLNDAGISAINAPTSPSVPTTNNVNVTIRNYGTQPLTTADIYYSVDGVVQTPAFPWVGSLAQFATAGPVTIGSYNFPFGVHQIKAWTANPNGAAVDSSAWNDTTTVNVIFCNPLNGNYTIGGTGADFANFTAAVNTLNDCGVSGPVKFFVASGTYTEKIKLLQISGASATNTITFESAALDSNAVVLQYTPTSATDNYTVWLNGADWVTFSKMTIKSFGNTALANVIVLNGNSCNNSFHHNRLIGVTPVAVADNYNMSVIYATKGSASIDSSNVYNGNRIEYGYCGIMDENTSGGEPGLQVINNYFFNQSRLATNLRFQSHPIISGNTVYSTMPSMYSASDMFGFHMVNGTNGFEIKNNNIYLSNASTLNYGTAINSCTATSASRGVFANNMVVINSQVTTSANYGIHVGGSSTYPNSYFDVYHNTVNVYGGANASSRALSLISGTATDVNIKNNIFSNKSNGYAMYLDYTTGFSSNYNTLYTTGTNLVYRGANFTTLALWQAATGTPDLNSVSQNPLFFSNTNLHLSNPAMNNLGTPIASVTTDIDGEARNATTPDFGADEFTPPADDAGITALVAPVNAAVEGTLTVTATLFNFGINTLTSANVNWMVDGNIQTPFPWTGSIASGAGSAVNIGTYPFTLGVHTIKLWSSLPNGNADVMAGNDTIQVNVFICGALNGTYSVGTPTSTFPTVLDAITVLNTCGVTGPVVMDIAPGTYTGQYTLLPVTGASATNTITFKSSTNTAADVILQFSASSSASNFVFKLDGADYIKLKYLTIKPQGGSFAKGVVIRNAATYNEVSYCVFQGPVSTLTSNEMTNLFSESGTTLDSYNTISNNTFLNNTYAVYFYGSSSSVKEPGNVFTGNTITNPYYYALYLYYQDSPQVTNNTISATTGIYSSFYSIYCYYPTTPVITGNTVNVVNTTTSTCYGIYDYYSSGASLISGNKIYTSASGYGIYHYYISGNQPTAAVPSKIFNNMVRFGGTGTFYGLYHYNIQNTKIYHNTIVGGGSATYYCLYVGGTVTGTQSRNNILANLNGGYAVYGSSTSGWTSNYNNLYTSGSNLGYWAGAKANLTAWQLGSNQDWNSISVYPYFAGTYDLHTNYGVMGDLGTPLADVTVDIDGDARSTTTPDMGADEFLPAPYEASVLGFVAPVSGCGLSEYSVVTIKIKNNGAAAITPNMMTASYQVNGGTPIAELVNATINPGQQVNYSFATTANLSAPLNDLTFALKAFISLPGDGIAVNDTTVSTVQSGWVPPAPYGINDTVSYAQMASLEAISPSSVWWYNGPVGGSTIYMGNPYAIGPLYDTVTYYAASVPSSLANIVVGTGATGQAPTSSNPYGQFYTGNKNQYLFKASELAAAGIGAGPINSLAFNVITPTTATSQGNNLKDFTVKIGATTLNAMTSSYVTGLTQVFYATQFPTVAGWNTHTFSTPFVWDGESNIVIETCFDNYVTSGNYTSNANLYMLTTPFVSNTNNYSDGGGVCPMTGGTTYTLRPQVRFNAYTAGCPSEHVPVTAIVQNIPANDAGIVAISSPQTGIELCNELVTVTIQNWGFSPITNFQINYEVIETGTLVSEILQDTVYSGNTLVHTFVTPADLCDFGTYTIVAYTSIAGDTYNVNDTTTIVISNDSITYCVPTNTYGCTYYYINNVVTNGAIQNIANPTACNGNGYTYFPSQEIVVQPGMTFTVNVGLYSTYTGVNIWADWNHNGDFTDAGEYVFYSYGYGQSSYVATITVPITATPGPQRLRVMASYYYPTISQDPCSVGNYGEVEDYLLTINPILDWDAGISAITNPTVTYEEGTILPVKAILRNFGNNPLTALPIFYTINGGTPVQYDWTGNLALGQVDTVNLGNMTVPGGNYTLCVYSALSTDMYAPNNQKCLNLYGDLLHEVKIVTLIAPQSGCDLGMANVTIKLKNIGNQTINGGLSAGYYSYNNTPVLEQILDSIPVDSFYIYTFVTQFNMAVTGNTAIPFTAFVNHVGDPNHNDDSLHTTVYSNLTPGAPSVTNQTVYTGASAVIPVNSPVAGVNYFWYEDTTATHIATGTTFTSGPLTVDTTFFVKGVAGTPSTINLGAGTLVNSTTTYPTPYGQWYNGSKEQYLIRASELTALGVSAGPIASIAFNVTGLTSTNLPGFTIKCGNTTANDLSSAWLTGLTTVLSLPGYVPVMGWNTHTFATEFIWDGTSNLVIEVCFNNYPNGYTYNCVVQQSATSFVATRNYHSDSDGALCSNTTSLSGSYSQRPNMKIMMNSAQCPSTFSSVNVDVEVPAWDVAVTGISDPISGVLLTNAENVAMTIYNNGYNAVSNFSVSFAVNGGTPVIETVTATIAPGATYTYNFTGTANLSSIGSYTLTCAANMSGDLQAFNNSYSVVIVNSPPCTPVYSSGCGSGDMLTSMSFGSINLSSISCTGSYMNFTTPTYELTTGIPLLFTGTVGYSGQYVTIWIDFNNNGTYSSDEIIQSGMYFTSSGVPYTFTITIPATANLGVHGMRVTDVWLSTPSDPCGSYGFGATMDFVVNLVPDALIYVQGTTTNSACFGGASGSVDMTVVNNGATPPYTYLWSTGATTEDINGLAAGVYTVTVTDSATPANTNQRSFTISQPTQILTSIFGTNATAYGAADGVVDLWVFNGTPPYTFQWFNGAVTEDLSGVTAGNYIVTVTDANGCTVTNTMYLTSPLPTGTTLWNQPIQTSVTHTIDMAANAAVTIDGANLAPGALVGVFYDSLTYQRCAGYVFWNGAPVSFTAYGNNPSTPGPDGFAAAETFKWKVLQFPAGLLGTATAVYNTTYPQNSTFVTNGLSGISSVTGQTVVTQNIPLAATWGIWSTYVTPPELPMNTVIQKALGIWSSTLTNAQMNTLVAQKINIIKNYSGQVYWPSVGGGLNSIGNLNNAQGYQVKAVVVCTLSVTGQQIQPQNYNLSLPNGWSLISYLRTAAGSTPTMMGTGTSNAVISGTLNGQSNGSIVPWIDIMKNAGGQVYWPSIPLNSIGTMKPGQGYQIKMRSTNWTNASYTFVAPAISFPVTYKYPANSEASAKEEWTGMSPVHYAFDLNTGNNMSLGIPVSAWAVRPNYGDEFAVLNSKGEVLGAGVFEGEPMAVAIWGDDETTSDKDGFANGETLRFVLWNSINGQEQTLSVTEWERGEGLFSPDGISMVKKFAVNEGAVYSLGQNHPNPFQKTTTISFSIPEDGQVSIAVYNLMGEKIADVVNTGYKAGSYTVDFATDDLSAGTYFYRMISKDFVATRQMILNR